MMQYPGPTPNPPSRPNVFEYESVAAFVRDMLSWRRIAEPKFSVAKASASLNGCSKALITRVAQGTRRLTRDRVSQFAEILNLSHQEQQYLDNWIGLTGRNQKKLREGHRAAKSKPLKPRNHLLSDWLHPYVKDCLLVQGFKPDPETVGRLLGNLAGPGRIARSLQFLFREGFFRRRPDGQVVLDEPLEYTTDGLPDERIRQFHKRSLDIAKKGLDRYPLTDRRAEAFLMTLNDENIDKLKTLLAKCMDEVVQFRQEHQADNQRLFQVIMHLTPLSERANGDDHARAH